MLQVERVCPKPTRPVPSVLFSTRNEGSPLGGVGWTLNEDWSKENKLRWERNVLIKEQLRRGEHVIYRSSGSSMWPRVKSNDLCQFEPFPKDASVEKDINVRDIVFCEVQPSKFFYAHFVLEKSTTQIATSGTAS